MMRAVAIDDEPLALDILRDYCRRSAHGLTLETFTSTSKALKYCTDHPVDILFLDIQMPAMSGLEFYNRLPGKPNLVFTTAHPGFALDGFEAGAFDYLLKPIAFERFEEAVLRVVTRTAPPVSQSHHEIRIKANYGTLLLSPDEIVFAESFGDHLHIHMADGQTHELRLPMKTFLEMMPVGVLTRIHRSYAVANARISFVRNRTVYIEGKSLPIGRKFSSPI